ncbi:hypothetical protein S7711_03167 [Stachybotrys chartarum IBT 7711]|uniref:Carboxylic ester hydrolase n=1 Tax=Stachybotrys chartarum (strain CBS 109288 / IBT 7711) TaxID=1280523 RepID=A0A084AWK2_STACB|nr:hypothetical protein S7711_03167 [Stachybotrys chartarum IBT 7711]KFA49314.1 hypothetical protein S40293_04178 [Stachybotrys chartarum IBT 40293]
MSPTITVNGCAVTGTTKPSSFMLPKPVDIFYGIPYARATRFHAAELLDPGPGGSMAAHRPGPSTPFPMAPHATSEDPLTLNIFKPSSSSPAPLPVVVYVHGGGFNFGHPLERNLASLLAWAERPLVVVAVGYRLGPLGFLAGAGPDVGERNLGLGDQRLAVEWVRKWVGAFGGDAGDLTLMGVSAGAHSIGHHLLHPSPLPFRKAILESGSPTARSTLSATHPRVLDQLRSLRAESYNAPLATLPVAQLLEASVMIWAQHAQSVCWPFQPVVDDRPGSLVPDLPLNLWAALLSRTGPAAAEGLAVITGFCSHEGTQFVPQRAQTNAEFRGFFATLIPSFTQEDLNALEALYPDPVTDPSSPYSHAGRQGAQFRRLYEAYGHYAYICPVLHTAHLLSRAGARVYLYEYAAVSMPFRAAGHGDQAVVVAHDMDAIGFRPGLVAVAREMNPRWTNFAAKPDGDLGDAWPLFRSPLAGGDGDGSLLVFGEGNDEAAGGSNLGTPVRTRTLTQKELDQCRFWWDRMELSQGLGLRGAAKPS